MSKIFFWKQSKNVSNLKCIVSLRCDFMTRWWLNWWFMIFLAVFNIYFSLCVSSSLYSTHYLISCPRFDGSKIDTFNRHWLLCGMLTAFFTLAWCDDDDHSVYNLLLAYNWKINDHFLETLSRQIPNPTIGKSSSMKLEFIRKVFDVFRYHPTWRGHDMGCLFGQISVR